MFSSPWIWLLLAFALLVVLAAGAGVFVAWRILSGTQRLFQEAWALVETRPDRALPKFVRFLSRKKARGQKKDPQVVRACVGRALCLYKLGHHNEAVTAEDESQPFGPITPADRALLAETYLREAPEKLPWAAIRVFARYLRQPARDRDADLSRRLIERLQALVRVSPPPPEDARGRILQLIDKLREEGYADAWLLSRLGQLLLQAGRHDDAVTTLRESLQKEPGQADARLALGMVYAAKKDHRAARAELLTAYRLAPTPQVATDAAQACVRSADVPLTPAEQVGPKSDRPLDTAIFLLRYVTSNQPNAADGWLRLGLCHLQMGQHRDAIAAIEQALALEPGLAAGHSALGQCYVAMGEPAKAREYLSRALKENPDSPQAHTLAGDLAYAEGKYAEALDHYVRSDLGPLDDPAFGERLARCHLEAGDPKQTVEILSARRLDRPDQWLLLGRGQARTKQWADALKTLEQADPATTPPQYRYYYANALAANGKHAEAETILTELASQPEFKAQAQRQLGHIKALQGQYPAAQEYYRGTGHPEAAMDLARLYLLAGETDPAKAQFGRAQKQGAKEAACVLGLALADANDGDTGPLNDLLQHPDLAPYAQERLGTHQYENRQYVEALEHLEPAAKRHAAPSGTMTCRLANSYLLLNRHREALPHLVDLSRRFPRSTSVRHNLALCRYQLGLAHYRRGQWELARDQWSRAAHLVSATAPEKAESIRQWQREAAYRSVVQLLTSQTPDYERAQNFAEAACRESPGDARWWFAAGLAAALRDDHRRAVECFGEAFKHDQGRPSFVLGAGLSFQALNVNAQARKMLDKALTLSEHNGDATKSPLPVATRFALAMACAKDQDWPTATKALEPLLDHPLIKGSNRVAVEDVAQIMVAYLALAGEKEKAAELARKHLKEGAHVGEVLVGLVQAESGDYAGAAETLQKVYDQNPSPGVLEVLVSCLLAEAAACVLRGDMPAAGPLVRKALKLQPNHARAKKLDDALNFSSRLKNLDTKQLDKTIVDCEEMLNGNPDSPHVLRALAVLYHRKAIQAEKGNKHAKGEWATCLKFWKKRLLDNEAYWDRFLEDYNAGKGKMERLKPDEVMKWRVEVVKELIGDHRRYAVHYLAKRDVSAGERHLSLIWEWDGNFQPPDNFMANDLGVTDEAASAALADVVDNLSKGPARAALGQLAAQHWVGKAIGEANRAVALREQAVGTANVAVALVNSLGSAAAAMLSQIQDMLRNARSLAYDAQKAIGEAKSTIKKAGKLAPKLDKVKETSTKIDEVSRQIDADLSTIRGLCSQVHA